MPNIIEQDDLTFLEANRHHYTTWVKAQFVQHLDGATRSRMLSIIRKYFASNYIADLWCQSCVAAMLVYLYVQYDKWLEEQPAKEAGPLIIENTIDLIGDFLGTIPVLQELALTQPVVVLIKEQVKGLAGLVKNENIIFVIDVPNFEGAKAFNLHGAFDYAAPRGLHMIQAHYHFMGLPVPADIPRPVLTISTKPVKKQNVCDYILAPFSRSLPEHEKWQREKWQALVDAMPDKKFILFGSSSHDSPNYVTGANVLPVFDRSFDEVANIMRHAKQGVISVVTGISHLAYALQVKNYLFFNQGAWGQNPDAVLMSKNIHDITVEEVLQTLSNGNS